MALPTVPFALLLGPDLARATGSHGNVLQRAQGLWLASCAGKSTKGLQGKRIGLVCPTTDDLEAVLLRQTASELGAHVSDVRPSLNEENTASDFEATARMLSKLYDAVILQGHPQSVVARLAEVSSVPVLDGIAGAEHPTAVLAKEVDPALPPADARRYVLQAVLLGALA